MILVIGCGRLGARFAVRMTELGHEVVIVDFDRQNFSANLPRDFKGKTIVGMEIDTDVLRKAGIEEADAVVIVSRDESTNMMVADVAKHIFNRTHVLVRIDQPQMLELYRSYGFEVVSPISEASQLLESKLGLGSPS